MSQHSWSGVFPAVTTPFHADLSIDFKALEAHLEVLLDSGVKGFVMMGSLGENLALTWDEKFEILKATKRVANGKVPVLSGVAETSSNQAALYTQKCAAIGIDGIMLMPAMVYRADSDEALAHYRTVAKATDLDILIYNNPIAYHVDLTPEHLEILCNESDKFVAIKESAGDVRRITDIRNKIGERLTIFAGVDDLALESVFLGATGWVAGIGLAFPYENQRLWELAMTGKWDEARELYRWYTPLLHLDVGLKFVQNIKLATQATGYCAEHVRLPRLPLTGAERQRVLNVIDEGIRNRPKL
ncbi:MAG: dihydrodipicolinate synthase family protein [Fimbriimonadales bacterium]|nr:dihydrodipicolinate synthase family protein [Fimbriimonadales bacterium]